MAELLPLKVYLFTLTKEQTSGVSQSVMCQTLKLLNYKTVVPDKTAPYVHSYHGLHYLHRR